MRACRCLEWGGGLRQGTAGLFGGMGRGCEKAEFRRGGEEEHWWGRGVGCSIGRAVFGGESEVRVMTVLHSRVGPMRR